MRAHGRPLQGRWDGAGPPPVSTVPPFRAAPLLETHHPFHIKMNPAIYLGPRCNHDLGVLLRMLLQYRPDGSATLHPAIAPPVPLRPDCPTTPHSSVTLPDAEIDAMTDALLEDLDASEYYCSTYATKEQPHVEGCCKR